MKSSEPGRKDYNLLAEANTHIDALIKLEKQYAKGSNIDSRPRRREVNQNGIEVDDYDDNDDIPLPIPQTVKYTVINPLDSQSDLETPSLPPPIPQAVKYTVIDPVNSQGDLEENLKSPPVVQNLLHPSSYQWTLQEFESMLDVTEAVDLFSRQQKVFLSFTINIIINGQRLSSLLSVLMIFLSIYHLSFSK